MKTQYKPQGVCSSLMSIEIEDGVVLSLDIEGGCPGNLEGIARLVEGMPVGEVVSRLEGIRCGENSTSCPDQLATALKSLLK